MKLLKGFVSRKFILSAVVMVSTYMLPVSLHNHGLSDAVVLAALAIVGGIGAVYGVVNIKDKPNG